MSPDDRAAGELAALGERAAAAVDVERLLQSLEGLVELRSDGGREQACQEHMASAMETAGLDVDCWPIDLEAMARHPAYCAEIDRGVVAASGASAGQPLGVVGSLAGASQGGRSLILNGHVDVVPPGDPSRWTVEPFALTRRAGWVMGRGALDMKGGLCSALEAVRAVQDAGIRPAGTVLLQSVVGEEDGGLGTLATIERGYRADGAVIPEPTSLGLATVQAGCLGFRLTVPGVAAHGCFRTEGRSAIDHFELVHRAMRELERAVAQDGSHSLFEHLECPYPLSVGTIEAGEWSSSVPDRLIATGRYGVPPDWTLEAARERFEEMLDRLAGEHPELTECRPVLEWWGGVFEPASTPSHEPIVTALADAAELVLGRRPEPSGVPYGSDMRLLTRWAGVPTVLFGPGDVRLAHGPDERVRIGDLERAARVLAALIVGFCGVAS